MKLLLHICCAPCALYPLQILRDEGHEVVGLFYNPNIHPYLEYKKRLDTLLDYAATVDLKLITPEDYGMEEFLRNVAFRETTRCRYCYHCRLSYAAGIARRGKFDGFTSTLLYSKFQQHDLLQEMGEDIAGNSTPRFFYRDFRIGWKEGIETSKSLGMYRQQYCGCIYSEKERYLRIERKKKGDTP